MGGGGGGGGQAGRQRHRETETETGLETQYPLELKTTMKCEREVQIFTDTEAFFGDWTRT